MPGGEALIDGVERGFIVGAEVGRRAHAGQQHRRSGIAGLRQNPVEIGLHLRRGQAAQAVVGAELDDHDLRFIGEHPVEPRQPAGAGIAGDPGVDYPPGVALGPERGFQARREGVLARQSEAGGQAVAEHGDPGLPGGARRRAEKQEPRAQGGSDPRCDAAGGAAG